MAFVSEMVDQLRDLLNDATDSQVPIATKKMFLNRGIVRLWPRMYRIVNATINLVADTYDYSLAVAIADGYIISVELSTASGGSEYERLRDYDIIAGDEDLAGTFRMTRSTSALGGYTVRIRYAAPISPISASTYANMQSEVFTGPDRALNLPVLYAMGLIAGRRLDDRQDHTRYSTTQAANGVTDTDIMQAQQLWLGQFELELDAMERPLPIASD